MIEFKVVRFKNFQSVGNNFVEIQLDRSPTTLVSGANGAGKSNVLESISYCLFNKSLKKVKLGDLINHFNKKNLLVEVELTTNGKDYKIVRGEKPKKFEFYCDGEMYKQDANSRDLQSSVEYVLGCDHKTFTQMIMLNKERYVPFMSLTTAERRKVIEDILDINVFSYANDIVKTEIRELSMQASDIEYKRAQLQERIKGILRLKEQAEANVQQQIDSMKDDISPLRQQMDEFDVKIQKVTEYMKTLEEPENEAKCIHKIDKLRKMEYQSTSKEKELTQTVKFYTDNETCSTCKQPISEEFKHDIITQSSAKLQQLSNVNKKLTEQLEEVNNELKQIKQQEQIIIEAVREKRTLENNKKNVEQQIVNLEYKISKLEQDTKNTDVAKFEEEYKQVKQQIQELESQYSDVFDKQKQYESLRDYLKDTGIKAKIIREYIDFINKKINEYLRAMDFYISITLDENFNEVIQCGQREKVAFDTFSTGQKARVNLAIWMSLLEVASIKNSVTTNLLMLDEILENIDADGVEMFMRLVNDKLSTKNVFVITQRADEFREHFRSEIKFKLDEHEFTVKE